MTEHEGAARGFLVLALALTGCMQVDWTDTSPAAVRTAASALTRCKTVCPPHSAAMVVTTVDSDIGFSQHYSCGCLDTSKLLPPAPSTPEEK